MNKVGGKFLKFLKIELSYNVLFFNMFVINILYRLKFIVNFKKENNVKFLFICK